MATRWSRLRGELYLARKSDGGEVADVEEHTEVLLLGGNRTKALGGGGFLARRLRHSSGAMTSGGGEGMEKWSGECVGQARGGFKTRLAMPGRPRCVACALR